MRTKKRFSETNQAGLNFKSLVKISNRNLISFVLYSKNEISSREFLMNSIFIPNEKEFKKKEFSFKNNFENKILLFHSFVDQFEKNDRFRRKNCIQTKIFLHEK